MGKTTVFFLNKDHWIACRVVFIFLSNQFELNAAVKSSIVHLSSGKQHRLELLVS